MQNRSAKSAEALIISAGWSPGAYDIARSLGMAGILSHIASSQPSDIGFYSRYCAGRWMLPCFKPENYGEIVIRLQKLSSGSGEKPVLFYASDPELWFVWRYRHQLEPFYRFLLPPDDLIEKLFNKVLFAEFAREHELPIPRSATLRRLEELQELDGAITFPCIVKPAYSQDWIWDTPEQETRFGSYKKALRRFDSKAQLLDFCGALPEREAGVVIQEYIDGRDESIDSFHGYFDKHSRCLGYFLGRKIRTYPPHTGGSAYVRTIHNETLARLSDEYLRRIGFQGIVKIDYKWDDRTKVFNILEINPRFNLWELLGAYAGVNLASVAYHDQRGESVEWRSSYTDDARLLYAKQDLRAYWTGYRHTGEWTFISYVRSMAAKLHFRVFDPRDPLPFVVSALAFLLRNGLRMLGVKMKVPKPGEHAFISRRRMRGQAISQKPPEPHEAQIRPAMME
ncbi:MAG TPA: hypothetical protein VES59_03225 [Bacteroidota bacterium]|nr:hypothetical protein [Bacteroidota bacterium]